MMLKKLAKLQGKVMCKCSYIVKDDGTNNKNRRNTVLPSSSNSSSQPTTPTNPISSPSPSTSRRRISTTFFSSPRGSQGRVSTPRSTSSPRRSQALESRYVPTRDEARIFLPQIKRGKLKRRVTIGSTQSTSSGSGDVDEVDWPPFADEDYIVFCFEEDGAFHVVMEESPKTDSAKLQCEFHGNVSCACTDENNVSNLGLITNRRDCLLPNQEGDEEEQLSPKLQQDGPNEETDLLDMEKEVVRKESTESMECVHGSVDSAASSRSDSEEQHQVESLLELEVEYSSSPRKLLVSQDGNDNNVPHDFRIDSLLPDTMFEEQEEEDDDEEVEILLSPKSQLGLKPTINDLLKDVIDDSCTGSDESRGSDAKDNHSDQLVEDEEVGSESSKSSVSDYANSCTSSFEFPVLQWEWIDSPVTWPQTGRLHFRKQKSKPSCLRCCKF